MCIDMFMLRQIQCYIYKAHVFKWIIIGDVCVCVFERVYIYTEDDTKTQVRTIYVRRASAQTYYLDVRSSMKPTRKHIYIYV